MLKVVERRAFANLAAAHRQLSFTDGRVCINSEVERRNCATFLVRLDECASALRVKVTSRAYRAHLTSNYRELLRGNRGLFGRSYRVDLLSAIAKHHLEIAANGERFEVGPVVIAHAYSLRCSLADLGNLLDSSRIADCDPLCDGFWNTTGPESVAVWPRRRVVRHLLEELDGNWARFEQAYIGELIEAENKLRRPVVLAIQQEQLLHMPFSQSREYQWRRHELVVSLGRLCSLTEVGQKEFAFDHEVLVVATELCQNNADSSDGAYVLAAEIVDSFEGMRDYLRQVSTCWECLDPLLRNNSGLVRRLTDLEESWSIGVFYLQRGPMLNAVRSLVEKTKAADHAATVVVRMCDEFDAELFLVLPRIVWLCFLAAPVDLGELLKSLLPERFHGIGAHCGENPEPQLTLDAEVNGLLSKFLDTRKLLVVAHRPTAMAGMPPTIAEAATWKTLVHRAVLGADATLAHYDCLLPEFRAVAQAAVDDLMRDLERWSVELQRYRPTEWNRCSAVLICFFTGKRWKRRQRIFQV